MMERYTPQAQEALGLAVGVAETLNHGYVAQSICSSACCRKGPEWRPRYWRKTEWRKTASLNW